MERCMGANSKSYVGKDGILKRIDYRRRVLEIYPNAKPRKCVNHFWIWDYHKDKDWKAVQIPAYQICYPKLEYNWGWCWISDSKESSPNKAWKRAWKSINYEMIRKLEG